MFPVRMSHPLHGFTHVYDETEQKRLEGNGWAVEKTVETMLESVTAQAKKRGRPKKVSA